MNLLNMLQWLEVNDKPSLFNDIKIPVGIDKNVLVDKIVYDNWDLEPIVTDESLFKRMIDNFFNVKYDSYTHIYNALQEEYNPLHNYDRHEDRSENKNTVTKDVNINSTKDVEIIKDDNTTTTTVKEDNKRVQEDKVSAYNSTSYQPNTTSTIANDNTTTNTVKEDNHRNDTRTIDSTDDRDVNVEDTYKTANHLYGNIGVTTSQQMLESEISLRSQNNIYELISLDFRNTLLILLL